MVDRVHRRHLSTGHRIQPCRLGSGLAGGAALSAALSGRGGGMLQEEAKDAFQNVAHPVVQVDIGEFASQEIDGRPGVVGLE